MDKRYLVSLFAILTSVFVLLGCGEENAETTAEDNATSQQTNNDNSTSGDSSDNSSNDNSTTSVGSNDNITVDSQTTTTGTAPTQVVFSKIIKDPEASETKDYQEWSSEVIITSEGGYVIVRRSVNNAWPTPDNVDDVLITKLDRNGEVLWNKKINNRNFDRATSVVEDNDGNYILTGFTPTNDSNKSDVLFVKVGTLGTVLIKTAIKITNNYDGGYSISKTSDGGYIVIGATQTYGNGDFDFWLIFLFC